jgi:hypothetical protein
MRDWWRAFDELHARQAPGMPSLWGLLGVRFEDKVETFEEGRYTHRGYELLPTDLNERIERLWGTAVPPRWPQALVTEPYPQASFVETLGPGIEFWHGVALTCWFICEGRSSRTDIPGMPEYYDRQIKELEELGCPIDHRVFGDLREAEKKLTDRPPDPRDTSRRDLGNGITPSITVTMGATKKDGFERLRDVLTRYRRVWTDQQLDRYLQSRWEQDLRGVGDVYHRHVADKGKPPTARQFAGPAKDVANRWFGGDLAPLANALGLPSRDSPSYDRMMPADRTAFVTRVRDLLGGARWKDLPAEMDRDERTRRHRLGQLADYAPLAVQVWEATGEPPRLKGTSWARFRVEAAFGEDTEAGWQTFISAVGRALQQDEPGATLAGQAEPERSPPADASGVDVGDMGRRGHGMRALLSRLRG